MIIIYTIVVTNHLVYLEYVNGYILYFFTFSSWWGLNKFKVPKWTEKNKGIKLNWIPDPHYRMSDRANLESAIQNIVEIICDFKHEFLESFLILQRFYDICFCGLRSQWRILNQNEFINIFISFAHPFIYIS